MIVSHKHKFIFLKTKKTAGTSIEISLSRYCGENDIITRIAPADERIRAQFGVKPQNYIIPVSKGENFRNNKVFLKQGFYNHIGAEDAKKLLGDDVWNSYFKFCFDRNPWDKVVSHYYFRTKGSKLSFDAYIRLKKFRGAFNYPLYTINDELAVDFLGKFENLEEDLSAVCKMIGIPFDGWLPTAKGNFRKDERHYHTIYDGSQKKIIENYFKKEIDLLGYEY